MTKTFKIPENKLSYELGVLITGSWVQLKVQPPGAAATMSTIIQFQDFQYECFLPELWPHSDSRDAGIHQCQKSIYK